MEYSPGNNIPYISRVDAGTIESVRDLGVEVVSSGDLVQRFEALWSAEALASHRTASDALYRVKDQAFALVRERLAAGVALTEFDVQQAMMAWMDAEGLTSADTPNVSAQENAGNPHYHPSREAHRAIRPNEVLLLDLWGKLRDPGAVFADITWVGFTGSTVPEQYARAFAAARDGRDAAVDLVQSAARAGRELRGFEVDRACRAVVEKAGYGAEFIHRTGHSLGETVHGNGVHLDDYETHDDRRLIPGTGFTIEPGVYTSRFGVRTEINMFMDERDAYVSGPRQEQILPLPKPRKTAVIVGDYRDVHAKDDGFLRGSDSHRVDCRRDGDRVAVGPAAGLVGTDHQCACREHGGAERSHRRADVPQHRQGAEPDGRQHPDDGAQRAAGS